MHPTDAQINGRTSHRLQPVCVLEEHLPYLPRRASLGTKESVAGTRHTGIIGSVMRGRAPAPRYLVGGTSTNLGEICMHHPEGKGGLDGSINGGNGREKCRITFNTVTLVRSFR